MSGDVGIAQAREGNMYLLSSHIDIEAQSLKTGVNGLAHIFRMAVDLQ